MRPGFVYMMASKRNGTIYLGCSSDLRVRAWQHRNKVIDGFSKENSCTLLVWYEVHDDIQTARLRERQVKKWKREWKLELIERDNPQWKDLFDTLVF